MPGYITIGQKLETALREVRRWRIGTRHPGCRCISASPVPANGWVGHCQSPSRLSLPSIRTNPALCLHWHWKSRTKFRAVEEFYRYRPTLHATDGQSSPSKTARGCQFPCYIGCNMVMALLANGGKPSPTWNMRSYPVRQIQLAGGYSETSFPEPVTTCP